MNTDFIPEENDYDLVRARTAPHINHRIDAEIEKSVRYYATRPTSEIDERIQALDREWDIERALQANAASVGLFGLTLGILRRRCWLALPVGVMGFLLMHSIQGWCPPVPLFRKAGVRTRSEIDREKFALKYLRGDFAEVAEDGDDRAGSIVEAVERKGGSDTGVTG